MKKQNFSRKREAIYNTLSSTKSHPTAEWVYNKLNSEYPDISLATVYRNISLFKEQGLVVSVGNVNGQERFDANVNPHSHFVCNTCGAVIDIMKVDTNKSIDISVANKYNFTVTHHNLTFYGECNICKELKS